MKIGTYRTQSFSNWQMHASNSTLIYFNKLKLVKIVKELWNILSKN